MTNHKDNHIKLKKKVTQKPGTWEFEPLCLRVCQQCASSKRARKEFGQPGFVFVWHMLDNSLPLSLAISYKCWMMFLWLMKILSLLTLMLTLVMLLFCAVDVNWSIGCITDGVAWLDKKFGDLGRAGRLWFQGIISHQALAWFAVPLAMLQSIFHPVCSKRSLDLPAIAWLEFSSVLF